MTVRYCKEHQQLLKHGFITTWVELIHELRDIRESPNHGLIFFQLPFTAVLLGLKFVSLGNSTRRVTFSLFSTHLVDESTLETKKYKEIEIIFWKTYKSIASCAQKAQLLLQPIIDGLILCQPIKSDKDCTHISFPALGDHWSPNSSTNHSAVPFSSANQKLLRTRKGAYILVHFTFSPS